MKISFKTLGVSLQAEVEEGCNYTKVLELFEEISGKSFKNLDLFVEGGSKVTDFSREISEDQTIIGVKSKHPSA